MKNLSLKLDEEVFEESEKIIKKIGQARNRYFNEAIDLYNKIHQRRLLQKKLKKESYLTREESISVLMEFEDLEYGDKAI
ncbi:hypothetical protein HZR84_14260 [Hyphobacterium sp. CCMP332]|nr:hypothetical protein HZR84_14260 [Hyphobacterium sp. CCMP332]